MNQISNLLLVSIICFFSLNLMASDADACKILAEQKAMSLSPIDLTGFSVSSKMVDWIYSSCNDSSDALCIYPTWLVLYKNEQTNEQFSQYLDYKKEKDQCLFIDNWDF